MENLNQQFLVNEYVCILPFGEEVINQLMAMQKVLNNGVGVEPQKLPKGLVLFRCRALVNNEKYLVKKLNGIIKNWYLNKLHITGIDAYPMHSVFAKIEEQPIIIDYLKDLKQLESMVMQISTASDIIIPLQTQMQPRQFLEMQKNIFKLRGTTIDFAPNEIWLLKSNSEQWIGAKCWNIANYGTAKTA